MGRPRRGTRVHHELFGPGTVVSMPRPDRAKVRFDARPTLPRTIMLGKLHDGEAPFVPAPAPARGRAPIVEVEPPPPPVDIRGDSALTREQAWQSLEAMRLGVVPSTGTFAYTVCRDPEIESLEALLDEIEDRGGGMRAVWGDYGAGKTHLLDAFEHRALERGVAASRVTVDPREIAIQNPARIWRAVIDRLRLPDGGGFRDLLESLVQSDDHADPRGPRASQFFTPFLFMVRAGKARKAELMFDYACAEPLRAEDVRRPLRSHGWSGEAPLTLPDYRTMGRVFTHMLGNLASWARDAGHGGLALVLDEVERVDALTPADHRRALEVLRHLAAVTVDPRDLRFDPEDLYRGGHRRHQQVPLRHAADQPLGLVMAMTPLEEAIRQFQGITLSEEYDIALNELPGDVSLRLALKIVGVYQTAYPDFAIDTAELAGIAMDVEQDIGFDADGFRPRIRATVARLDQLRLGRA